MKKQILDYIIIVLLILIIYVKDFIINQHSQIRVIETVLSNNLKRKLEDYEKLLKEYNLDRKKDFKCITMVKNRQPNLFYEYVAIYNNQNCELVRGDIVLNENGLLGTVVKVFKNKAIVSLITNPKEKISIRVNNSFGTLYAKHGKLYINDIVNESNIKNGDIVYTSGLTSIPKDIYIGNVVNTNNKNVIQVKEKANVLDNNYVSIYGVKE